MTAKCGSVYPNTSVLCTSVVWVYRPTLRCHPLFLKPDPPTRKETLLTKSGFHDHDQKPKKYGTTHPESRIYLSERVEGDTEVIRDVLPVLLDLRLQYVSPESTRKCDGTSRDLLYSRPCVRAFMSSGKTRFKTSADSISVHDP